MPAGGCKLPSQSSSGIPKPFFTLEHDIRHQTAQRLFEDEFALAVPQFIAVLEALAEGGDTRSKNGARLSQRGAYTRAVSLRQNHLRQIEVGVEFEHAVNRAVASIVIPGADGFFE